MLTAYSQCEIAFRDTLIHKAEGRALDRLGLFYGFPRLAIFERQYFRKALLEVAFGRRGTYRTLFKALEALFDQYSVRKGTRTIMLDPAKPHRLVHTEGLGLPFSCNDTGRFVRITSPTFGSKIYYSAHLENGELHLNPIDTPHVAGADWSSLSSPEQATAKVLGFMLAEPNPGPPFLDGDDHPYNQRVDGADEGYRPDHTCTVFVTVDSNIWTVPASYFQEDGTIDRTVVAPGQPFGGHMMDLFAAANREEVTFQGSLGAVPNEPHPESGDPNGEGPMPIYFDASGEISGVFVDLIESLLAAGVHASASLHEWCSEALNPFGEVFDVSADCYVASEGSIQRLPRGWDFNRHGVPADATSYQTVLDFRDRPDDGNGFFVFHNSNGEYSFKQAPVELVLTDTGGLVEKTSGHFLQVFSDMGTLNSILGLEDAFLGKIRINGEGQITQPEYVAQPETLGSIAVATFADHTQLAAVPNSEFFTETADSGAPILSAPSGAGLEIVPGTLDLARCGSAGYFVLEGLHGEYYYSQNISVTLDGRDVVTVEGYPVLASYDGFYDGARLTLPEGVDTITASQGVFRGDPGDGVIDIAQLTIARFQNPASLVEIEDPGGRIFERATSGSHPNIASHLHTSEPIVSIVTAEHNRLTELRLNGEQNGIIIFDGRENRLTLDFPRR